MNAHIRKARWLALTAGLVFLGGGILSADVSSSHSNEVLILYSTYLEGSGYEYGNAIAADEEGAATAAGSSTRSAPGTETPSLIHPGGTS